MVLNIKKGGDPLRFTEKLKALRGDRPQSEVAKAVGIAASTYSMYENGERNPSDPVKIRIADYFGVTVQYIFFE